MDISKIKDDILVGKEIFEKIPNDERPSWAKGVLMSFDNYIKKIPFEISELILIIDNQGRWREAHGQFDKIRQFLLCHKTYKPEAYLLLAENVAKVTYNASLSPGPFDADSGWWIPQCALQTVAYFADDKLKENVLAAILKK